MSLWQHAWTRKQNMLACARTCYIVVFLMLRAVIFVHFYPFCLMPILHSTWASDLWHCWIARKCNGCVIGLTTLWSWVQSPILMLSGNSLRQAPHNHMSLLKLLALKWRCVTVFNSASLWILPLVLINMFLILYTAAIFTYVHLNILGHICHWTLLYWLVCVS